MTPLRKADVEALLRDFDGRPIEALTVALRHVFDAPDASWLELITQLPEARRRLLVARNQPALDDLAAELNETRTVLVATGAAGVGAVAGAPSQITARG